jgi:hypothetical protein
MDKLQEATAATDKAFQELKAAMDSGADSSMLIQRCLDYIGSLQDQLGYMRENMYNHMGDGHLPKAPSRAHMEKAIKNLGWGDQYEAAPKQIVYANTKFGPFVKIGKDVEI